MPASWTVEYDGTTKSLASWGIRNARLTFRSLDVDELTFEIPRDDALQAATFPEGAVLELRKNATGWFRGTVIRSCVALRAQGEVETYVVNNAWYSLASTVYQQQRCVGGTMVYTTRVVLGQNIFGQKISIGRQIAEITQYALSLGVPVVAGLGPAFTECWKDEGRDLTCAGAIRTVLRLMPDAVGWFDYSSGAAPIFNVQESGTLGAIAIDVTSADKIVECSGITARGDLVPTGVKFIYETTTAGADGRLMTSLTTQTAGTPDGEGVIVATIELDPSDTPPANAALSYYTSLLTTPYEGSIHTMEEDCSGDLRPGKVLNLTGGRAEWAAMRAVIQIVTEHLDSGETIAEFGPAEHLAPQDFVQQQQVARKRFEVTEFATVQPCQIVDPNNPTDIGDPENGVPPTAPVNNPDAGVDPKTKDAISNFKNVQSVRNPSSFGLNTVDLAVCEDGVESSVTVYAPSP